MKDELQDVKTEIRSISDKINDGSMKTEEAKVKLEELRIKKREIEQKIAQADVPIKHEERVTTIEDIRKAMLEKRSITLNGTGAINQIRELQHELQRNRHILSRVKYFFGPNASTNIPIWSPTLAVPANVAEGETNVAVDNQARLGSLSVTPYAYVSILPVSAETLALGSVNLEAELPQIFADAFADGFARQVVTGNGTGRNFDGMFNDTGKETIIECANTGNPKIMDLVNLALTMKDYTDNSFIIMTPSVYSIFQSDSTPGLAELYKEELIRTKTIEGVSVLLTGYALSDVTAGSTVAVALRANDYAFALASEIHIEPLKRVGDTNTYFQATVFANGTKIINKNVHVLKTK